MRSSLLTARENPVVWLHSHRLRWKWAITVKIKVLYVMFLVNWTSQSGRITLESEFSSPQDECPLRTLNQTGCKPSLASCMMVTWLPHPSGKAANVASTSVVHRRSNEVYNLTHNVICGRSRWPYGLRRRSAASWLLGSQVRIPLRAYVFVYSVRYVLCRQRLLLRVDYSFRRVLLVACGSKCVT